MFQIVKRFQVGRRISIECLLLSLSPQLKMTLAAFFLFHGVCPICSTAIVTVEKEGMCPSNRYGG
jgi:hypothetical protein